MFRSFSREKSNCSILVNQPSVDQESEPDIDIPPTLASLSKEQKTLLRESFRKMKTKHFQSALMNYLQDYPTRKSLFPKLRNLSDIEIATNPALVPAQILSIGFDKLTAALDSEKDFNRAVNKIVQNHLKFKIRKEHITEIEPHFLNQLKDLDMKDREKETKEAWILLVRLLLDQHKQ